jgi:hypothetical protein
MMILILLVLDGAAVGESGEYVSLLSRTPKACASRQFWDCASCRFPPTVTIVLNERDLHSTIWGPQPTGNRNS